MTEDLRPVVDGFGDPRRLRCVRQPLNDGIAAARNRDIVEAQAPLVAFPDPDGDRSSWA